jgi:hypothetical protein
VINDLISLSAEPRSHRSRSGTSRSDGVAGPYLATSIIAGPACRGPIPQRSDGRATQTLLHPEVEAKGPRHREEHTRWGSAWLSSAPSTERGAGISCFCFFFSPPTLLGCLCQNHVSIAISKINHARPFFSSSLFFFAHIVHHGWRRGRTGGRAMAPLYGPGVGVWHGTGRDGTGQGDR